MSGSARDSTPPGAKLPRDQIQVLPEGLANRIAAGEVVERPASVIKELVENAIDAEASRITIAVKRAGLDEMLVADDGWGMDEDDVVTALRRHATSKLRSPEDLQRILHFGFRGEALPSIASVSRLELVSRREDREHGVRYEVNGGDPSGPMPAQRERGTSIKVRALFYNVPARRKFLRTPATEYGHIVKVFKQFALAYPEYHWTLEKDGKEEYALTPGSLSERIAQLFGEKAGQDVHEVESRSGEVFVTGVVGGSSLFRKSRGDQFLYVNRRPIQSNSLHHAVVNGFGPLIERGQVPFFVLNLRLDPEEFDVNVHPAKHEVRFRDEGNAYRAVLVSIRKALGVSLRAGDAPVKAPFGSKRQEGGGQLPGTEGQEAWRQSRPRDGRHELELLLGKPPRQQDEPIHGQQGARPGSDRADNLTDDPRGQNRTGSAGSDITGDRSGVDKAAARPAVPPPPPRPTREHDPNRTVQEGNVAYAPGIQTGAEPHGGTSAPGLQTGDDAEGEQTPGIHTGGKAGDGEGTPTGGYDPHKGQPGLPAGSWREGQGEAGAAASYAQRLNVWQVHRTYILSQTKSGLVIIDQHVAHERILFEKALAAMRDRPWTGQRLLFPVGVALDPAESALMDDLRPALARMGMEVEPGGGNLWEIHSVPAGIRVRSEEKLLRDLLADYRQEFDIRMEPQESLAASFACKAAIKAGDPLNLDEMNALIDELFTTEYPFVCPHGRPVIVNLTLGELHRLFGRE